MTCLSSTESDAKKRSERKPNSQTLTFSPRYGTIGAFPTPMTAGRTFQRSVDMVVRSLPVTLCTIAPLCRGLVVQPICRPPYLYRAPKTGNFSLMVPHAAGEHMRGSSNTYNGKAVFWSSPLGSVLSVVVYVSGSARTRRLF